MLTSLASDSLRDQRFRLRVLSSSLNREVLNILSKIFDLDDIDREIICLVDSKCRVQAKEIALHIYLSRDASRRRAIKLTEKEILEMVQAKVRNPGVIYFRLSSKIHSIISEIKELNLVNFSRKSFLKSQSSNNFTYLKRNQSLEEKIRSFRGTRRDVFFLVVILKQATSPLIAEKLGIFPQAVRYHLEWLRRERWLERSEFSTTPKVSYYYFVNSEIDRQIVESIIDEDRHQFKLTKQMNNEQDKLFQEEVPKLNAVDIDLLIEICHKPGSLSSELGKKLSRTTQTINRHLKKLIKAELAIREKDSNFEGVRYYYYPASSLTIEKIEHFSPLPISEKTDQNNITEETNMNDLTLSNSSDSQARVAVPDLFSILNHIEEEERNIEEEERKIQDRRSNIEKLKQEMIEQGGEPAEKFFSRR